MSLESAFIRLRRRLAREAKNRNGPKTGAPSANDYWLADIEINNMPNTALITALIAYDEDC